MNSTGFSDPHDSSNGPLYSAIDGFQDYNLGGVSSSSFQSPIGMSQVLNPTYHSPASSSSFRQEVQNHTAENARSSGSVRDGSEPPPPWAELKTKAGKDRKRLPLACVACRRKKIRCSGEKPACKHCLKSRTPCVYKVSTRKAGPRTDYMAMLDKRLKRMEERVIKIIPKVELANVPQIARATVRPAIQPESAGNHHGKRSAQEAFGGDASEWAGARPIQPEAMDRVTQPTPRTIASDDTSLLVEGKEGLPSREIQEHLAEVYFSYVYGQSYHLLHKPSFMRKLASGSVPPILLLAVCAVSARFSNHPSLKSEPSFLRGDRWAEAALEIALRRFDSPNITIMTVLLLLGLHEFGTCRGGRSWMLGGMAHRMAYALQLHKDLSLDPCRPENSKAELSFTDREIRRRTMWACFMMDRFSSSGTKRPMFASEDHMHIQLPVKEQYFIQEVPGRTEQLRPPAPSASDESSSSNDSLKSCRENLGVAAYMIRVVALWGRIGHYLNLGGREADPFPVHSDKSIHKKLRDEVDAFAQDLPDTLKFSNDNLRIHISEETGNQFLYLHIVHQQCTILVYRFAFSHIRRVVIPNDVPVALIQEARTKATAAASQISAYLERAIELRVVAPFIGYCAYLSSAVLVHVAFSRDAKVAEKAKQELKRNIIFLNHMKKYWGNFYFLAESLGDMWKQFADLSSKGASTPIPRAQTVFQYGDWYDRYPHGVTQMHFDEPITVVKKEPGSDAAMGQEADVQNFEQFSATLSPGSKARQTTSRGGAANKAQKKITKDKHSRNLSRAGTSSQQAASSDAAVTTTRMLPLEDAAFVTMGVSSRPTHPESYDRSPVFRQPGPQVMSDAGPTQPVNVFPTQQPPSSGMPVLDQQIQLTGGFNDVGDLGANMTPDMANFFWEVDFNNVFNEDFQLTEEQGWFMPFNLHPPAYDGTDDSFAMSQGPIVQQDQTHLFVPTNAASMIDLTDRAGHENGQTSGL